jgi:hypothetical protein
MNKKGIAYAKVLAVLLAVFVGGYYLMKIKSGGELAANFVSLEYKWGEGDSLQNSYHSKTGDYRFLDKYNKPQQQKFTFRTNNVIFMNSMINKQDLFDLPDTILNKNKAIDTNVLRYEFTFTYDNMKRHIVFYSNYDENPVIRDKAVALQQVVQQTIDEAQERYVAP